MISVNETAIYTSGFLQVAQGTGALLMASNVECYLIDIRTHGIFPVYDWRVFPFRWAQTDAEYVVY